jgi:tetratricopeptide (TPR) repeat protein
MLKPPSALSILLSATLALAAEPGSAAPRPQAPPAAADAAALLSRAVSLHQAGDLEGAVAAYEQLLALGAESPAIRSNLGAAYAQLGRYDGAIEQYRRALAADAGNVAIRRNLALAYYKTGRMSDAAQEAQAIVGAQPDNDAAKVLLADCLYRLGQGRRVIELLQPVAERSADRAVSYLLGMALIGEGRMKEAQSAIDRVLRDDSPEAHVFLAMMYLRDQDCDKALPEIRRALDGNPKLPLVNFLNGQCLMDEKRADWPGAMDAFRAELAVDANHFDANLYLGDLLREGARHDEALPYLERARRLRPDDLAAQFSLGAVYVALGRTEEALPLLEQVEQAAPDHLQTHMQLAVAYHRLGRTADSARERALVGKLQSEGESRFFSGVSAALGRLLGKTPTQAEPPAKP